MRNRIRFVGLPLARLFSTKFKTIGFDMNQSRVDALNSGHDATLEVSDELLRDAINNHGFKCTTKLEEIKESNFYVVAVPTPVDENNLNMNGHFCYKKQYIPKPKCLEKMIEIAQNISINFPEVRVDFYIVNDQPILGELTFTTGYGYFTMDYYNHLGSKIILKNKNSI